MEKTVIGHSRKNGAVLKSLSRHFFWGNVISFGIMLIRTLPGIRNLGLVEVFFFFFSSET